MSERIQDKCAGRWRSMLPALGVPADYLTGKHGPCPICKEGKDRFRFDDKEGSGSYYCNTCGAGSGVDLVMRVNRVDFLTAKNMIDEKLPSSSIMIKKAVVEKGFDCSRVWGQCHPVEATDPVGRYLERRGIVLAKYPAMMRYHPRALHKSESGAVTHHPAMVCKFVSPDAVDFTLHTTFLDMDGNKAKVDVFRKWAPRRAPSGGAIRLGYSSSVLGIAEGVETALSAHLMFGVTVWSAADAGRLTSFEPPQTVTKLIVFGDRDRNYAGQSAAYGLAHRHSKACREVDVKFPEHMGTDWNDVLQDDRVTV